MARRPVHISKTTLSPRKRATLRASDFAVPSERKYPINDLFHARLALTYVLTPSNAAYRDEVVRAVLARYPELQFWWASRSRALAAPARRKVANPSNTSHISEEPMPVYTLNPSHRRATKRTASRSPSLRERMTMRRNSLSEDGMTVSNPRAKAPTRKDELMRLAHEAGYHVETYSPGDGVTRYRFFDLAEMDRKRVPMSEQTYFGPLNGVHTALGLAAAKKWLSNAPRPKIRGYVTGISPGEEEYYAQRFENPAKRRGSRSAQKAGLAKGQSLMARAAAAYRAGEYGTMQEALKGIARKRNPAIPVGLLTPKPPPPPPKKTLRGAPVENPRRKGTKGKAKHSGGRTAAQSNAAKAMKLFHSGKASSLAEAWDMIRRGR